MGGTDMVKYLSRNASYPLETLIDISYRCINHVILQKKVVSLRGSVVQGRLGGNEAERRGSGRTMTCRYRRDTHWCIRGEAA
jgi:hypothetical protein